MSRLTVRSARAALLAAPLCVAALLPGDLAAQPAPPKDRLTVADYFNWEDVAAPAMSPDGKQIIYTRTWTDQLNDKRESSVWIMNADGTKNRFLVKGSDAKWSPDGSRIAYVAPGEPGGAQLWVRYMDAEGATTHVLSDCVTRRVSRDRARPASTARRRRHWPPATG